MIDPKIYLAKATKNKDGTFTDGEAIDIQAYFNGAKYNSVDGLETYGKPRTYTEEYPEKESIDVFHPNNVTREKTDFTLKLYFFDPNNSTDETTAIAAIDEAYHKFVEYITGGYIKFWDNVRQRKVYLSYQENTKPTVDKLYGLVYKDVSFKFVNVFGKSFPLDDTEKVWTETTTE